MARAHWVAIRHWGVLRSSEFGEQLKLAHSLIYGKLPKRTRDVLAMPPAAQRKHLMDRKKLLATRAAAR